MASQGEDHVTNHITMQPRHRMPRELTPREPREKIRIDAAMRGEFSGRQRAVVTDISQFGVGALAADILPDIGERVLLTLSTGDAIEGEVRWCDGHRFGLRLYHPFDLRRLRAINALRDRLAVYPAAAGSGQRIGNGSPAQPIVALLRPVC